MVRWLASLLVALLVVLASFVMILWMISPPKARVDNKPVQVGHFVPMSKNTDSQSRSRLRAPEPPPDQPPPKPQQQQPVPSVTTAIELDLPAPSLASAISIQARAMPSLDAVAAPAAPEPAAPALAGTDSEVMPLNEVLPEYPDMARRRGIEGYVRLGFVINAQGRVQDIEVLEAKPANIFDRSARRAAARWRFTPSVENGVAVARRAQKTIEFKLNPAR